MIESGKSLKVVVRFSHLGDVVLTTGILEYRHSHFQEEFIVITKKGLGDVFKYNPSVIQCIELDSEDLKGKKFRAICKELGEKYPYPLYDLHNNTRSKILKYFWKQDCYTYNKFGFARRLFLWSNKKIRLNSLNDHVVQRYYSAFDTQRIDSALILPTIKLSLEEKQDIQFCLENVLQEQNGPLICLHPFAIHKAKEWPEENWKILYFSLLEAKYVPLFIGKGTAYTWINHEHNYINTLSIRKSAALLSEALCLISSDSGPIHLANAVQCPALALFGPTAKEWGFFPLYGKSQVVENSLSCRPCSLHGKVKKCRRNFSCMNSIKNNMVLEAINNLK